MRLERNYSPLRSLSGFFVSKKSHGVSCRSIFLPRMDRGINPSLENAEEWLLRISIPTAESIVIGDPNLAYYEDYNTESCTMPAH